MKINFHFLRIICEIQKKRTRRKMDIQDQYLDIQLYEEHLTYSVLISKYSAVLSKIFILTYFTILHRETFCSKLCKKSQYILLF